MMCSGPCWRRWEPSTSLESLWARAGAGHRVVGDVERAVDRALPGMPTAAFVGFELFVRPVIRQADGAR